VLFVFCGWVGLRGGHAYQGAPLHRHALYRAMDDIEAAAARRSWLGALAEGFVFQFRIWLWALRNAKQAGTWIVGEGIACLALVGLAIRLSNVTPLFTIYAALMITGSWIFPFVSS